MTLESRMDTDFQRRNRPGRTDRKSRQARQLHALGGRDLIAAIRENRPPLCSAHDGRIIVEMISADFESQRLGGQRVTFPLKTRANPLTLL